MPSLVTPPRTCRVPVAPSHHPHPTFQTQPVGAQEPLDEGVLLGVFVAGTREPVTIPMSCQSASSASGGKSVTVRTLIQRHYRVQGNGAIHCGGSNFNPPYSTPPFPSPRFAVHGFDRLNGSCSGVSLKALSLRRKSVSVSRIVLTYL